MGRKKTSNRKQYFGDREEQALIDYISTDDKKIKNEIYETILKPAFKTMIESIIRRWRYFLPDEEYQETFDDTLSDLLTKVHNYDPSKGTKAFSYCGTICRRYLIGKMQAYVKRLERNPSYERVSEGITDNIKYVDDSGEGRKFAIELVESITDKIRKMIESPKENSMKENEVKLGKALINLFENWDFVLTTDASEKMNKNTILLFLRDSTGLTQKEIRDNLKKFKKEFYLIKKALID